MKDFVKLTRPSGRALYMPLSEMDYASYEVLPGGGTVIHPVPSSPKKYIVKETPEEIIALTIR